MDPVTALGLALAVLKLIMLIFDYLHQHPGIEQSVKDAIHEATGHLQNAITNVGLAQQFHLEAP